MPPRKTETEDAVTVRVLPIGDRRIQKGEINESANPDDDPESERFPTYRKGDVFKVDAQIAKSLEDRGFVEIQ